MISSLVWLQDVLQSCAIGQNRALRATLSEYTTPLPPRLATQEIVTNGVPAAITPGTGDVDTVDMRLSDLPQVGGELLKERFSAG